MRWTSLVFAALLSVIPLAAFAQEQAFTNRSTELKDKASPDARTVATLNENTPVKVTARSGGWTQIDAGGKVGYVRAFHLRFPTTVESSGSSGGSVLGGIFGGSKPRQATVATTGIRGLSAEDFKNASPDAAALQRMQSYRVDKAGAERFAREAKLASVSINYLMEEAASGRRR
jgi:uncharacterized protein YgiM (DUF1202 family)